MAIYDHTAGDRTPFTYVIHCTITHQSYFGVRYAKGCHPDQLWTTYFTSSKNIKKLIENHGESSFTFKVTKIFDCPKKALAWENKVLRRLGAIDKSNWINKSDGKSFRHHETLSDDVRKRMSEARKGVPRPRTPEHQANLTKALKGKPSHQKGKPLSDETKRKLSEKAKLRPSHMKGKIPSEEHRRRISEAKKGQVRIQSVTEKQKRSQLAKDKNFAEACKGLIWVNDGVTSKRIKPEDFESSGFKRGRLIKRDHISGT